MYNFSSPLAYFYKLFLGAMRDAFSHFARPFLWPYLIFGGCTILSGVMLFGIPFLKQKKADKNQTELDSEIKNSGKDLVSSKQQEQI